MFGHLKLGLRDPDPARVRRVKLLSPDVLPVDPLVSRVPRDWALGRAWDGDVLGNDQLGNCGPAAVVNWLKMTAAACGRNDLVFTRQHALDAYEAMGYDGTADTDGGVVLLDLMEYWKREGVGGVRIDCFFSVGFADLAHLATAVYLAPLVVGATLTRACQDTATWDAAAAADERPWGGHAYLYHADSPGGGSGKSWGSPVFTTPEFRARRWNEAYLPVCRELNPSGADLDRLIKIAGQL